MDNEGSVADFFFGPPGSQVRREARKKSATERLIIHVCMVKTG